MIATVLGVGLLFAAGFWLLGGVALRLGGGMMVLVGVAGLAAYGQLAGLFLIVIGFPLWLGGHWLYGLRHERPKSALADRILHPRRTKSPTA